MGYLKRLTLMGKVTDSATPVTHLFSHGLLNVGNFLKTVKPSAVRRVIRSQAGDRVVSIYQLVPPGTALPEQSTLLKSENVILSESNIRRSHGQLKLADEFARYGGQVFKELLAALDVLARYSHGNFTNAVIRFAYQWVFNDVMTGGANWSLDDERLGDALFQYLTATTAADVDYRHEQLSNYLRSERADRVIRPLADSIMKSVVSCRAELHAVPDTLSPKFQLTLKALGWMDKLTPVHQFKTYQPFGEWKAGREQFDQAFREYKDNRAWLDNFIRNVPEHAYVMLFLFSKYGELGNNPNDYRDLAATILRTAIELQKNRCFGLPAGVTRHELAQIIRNAYHGASQEDLQDEQRLRWISLLPSLITSADEVASPKEKLDQEIFLIGAEEDFSQSISRVFKDAVLARVKGAEQRQKALCNQARRIAALPWSRAEQMREFKCKLAAWEPLKTAPNDEDNFLQAVKQRLTTASALWKTDSPRNLYLDVTQALNEAVAAQAQESLKGDKAGTVEFTAAVKRYRLQVRSRIDSQAAKALGHIGAASTVDVSCQTNADRQELTRAEPTDRVKRHRARMQGERRREAASCRLADRNTLANVKSAKALPEQHVAAQDVSGGRLKIQTTPGHEIQLCAVPAEVPLQTAADHRQLSDSGLIVRKQDGACVGTYSRDPTTQQVATVYTQGFAQQADDQLVSGSVSVAPEAQFRFEKVTFHLTGNDLLAIGSQGDGAIQVRLDAKQDRTLQLFEFAQAQNPKCLLKKKDTTEPVEIAFQMPDQATVVLRVPVAFGPDDRFEFSYSLQLAFEQLVPRDEFSLSSQDLQEIGTPSESGISLSTLADDERARQVLEFAQLTEAERTCTFITGDPQHPPQAIPVKLIPGERVLLEIGRDLLRDEGRLVFRRNLAKSFPTPSEVSVNDLSSDQLGSLTTALLDDISALANEYTQPEIPTDNWHCAIRSRRFREEVLACPPETVPFGHVDLGVSFEAIARMIRHVGNCALPDLFKPQLDPDLTSLPDLDLSVCFPVNTVEDVQNVITQYIIVCKEDQALLPYRQELNEALVAVEQLGKDQECSLTFVDSTLEDYVATLPPAALQPANAFFATHPTCFFHVLRCGAAEANSLGRLATAFDQLTAPNGVAPFRYPLVTTAADLQYSKWWFVPQAAIAANLIIDPDPKNRLVVLDLRNGAGNFSWPLACILALLLEQNGQATSTFDIGSKTGDKWSGVAIWDQTDTLGTAILKIISQEWAKAQPGDRVAEAQPGDQFAYGLWPILATQRVNNMSLARHRAANNVPGFLGNIQEDYMAAVVLEQFFNEGIGSLPLVPPVHTGADHLRRILIVENAAKNASLQDAASAPCPVGAALKFKRG